MAIRETEQPVVLPPTYFTVTESYTVHRLGRLARVEVWMQHCNFWMDEQLVLEPTEDPRAYVVRPMLDRVLVGHDLARADNTLVGRVTEQVELVGDGLPIGHRITVDRPIDLDAGPVFVVEQMIGIGTTAYRPAPDGRRWLITLRAEDARHLPFIQQAVLGAGIDFGRGLITALGLAVVDEAIVAAVQRMALGGENIDGAFARQAEQLEQARRAGLIPD